MRKSGMRKRPWLFALACLLSSAAAWGGGERELPADAYGRMALEQLSERVGHIALPKQQDHYVELGQSVAVDGGTLTINYGAAGGDDAWRLVSYRWVPEKGIGATAGTLLKDPNPHAPTRTGSLGDHQTHSLRLGAWHYTIRYEVEAEGGGLAWKITDFSAANKPDPDASAAPLRES